MDSITFLMVALQLYGTGVEGKFVDSTVKLTEKVKLDCVYPKKAMIIQTSWMKRNLTHKANIAVLHPIYGIHIENNYKGRIHFQNDSGKDKSLSFIKSTLEDVGVYFCSIQTYPDGIWEKVIKIIQPADAFELPEKQNNLVLTEPGGNVTFTCPYNIGDSVQQVMWERIKADRIDSIALCNSLGEKSFGSDFEERALVACAPEAGSTVVLRNVTASDFAMYRCVATGRNRTHAMSFTVAAPLDHQWFIIYIAGGISAAFLLLVFLLIFCITTAYHKKRKRKRITQDLAKALHPPHTWPVKSYGRSNFHGTENTERSREESSLSQTEEIYVNCRSVSHKPKKRLLTSFLV
ncbi:CD226 antigen [Rhea pennata]|uniref:CD226 antigen n=1 Tax=Rhea pennata TaxID=8795 RepID=UPI002E257869